MSKYRAAASSAATTGSVTNTQTTASFNRSLTLGATGSDVKALQVYLNTHGYTVSTSGAGSRGNETMYFGPATRSALSRFQAANRIYPTVGFFGPLTRAFVNKTP